MPQYLSSFTPCGMLYCSSQPSNAHRIYMSMRASQGNDDGAFREFGYQGAKLYATAMMLARIVELYLRVKEQHEINKLTFALDDKEKEYGVISDLSLTDEERRRRIRVRELAGAGSSKTDLETALAEILGNKFVELIPPWNVFFDDLVNAYPTTPPSYANFKDSTTSGKWLKANHNWGPNAGNLQATLMCGDAPELNDVFVFGSKNESTIQKCTVTSVASLGNNVYELGFSGVTKPVEKDQGFTSNSYPIWGTGRRRFLIEMTVDAQTDANLLADVDSYMQRAVRGTTIWQKAAPANQLGGFQLNGGSNPGKLGFTLLETP